ncbi:putative exported protein [Yersinia rochesterensis]|uniref:Exported protein n=1 Tax=Yersinia rochesterensis TaxID=1604335 RepID=A0ABM5SPS7_9GAMM|nr:hypothetical protein [Yersinia rochesterensis]AIN20114.1 hypothetical protein DJ57_1910 [Yersinia rochesterensis]AJI89092.1 hypothetical protein AW19_599 [Yersinia frederiksenii Y225]AJJ36394.1 putative exported protein [Yersinia rochesterensis]CRY59576.1 Uncharacterised protein [Yersinia kristensenii]
MRIINLTRSYFGLATLLALLFMPIAEAAQSEYIFLSTRALQHNQWVIAEDKEKDRLQKGIEQADFSDTASQMYKTEALRDVGLLSVLINK